MPRNFRKFQCLLLAACLAAGMAGLARAGQVSFSTYYPAPFGVYDRLRLPPRAALTAPCDAGTFYYETGVGLRFCDEATQAWGSLGGGVWTQSGDNIYPNDTATNPNLNVGIGTTVPDAKLKIINTTNNADLAIGNTDFARSRLDFLTELTGQPEARIEVVGQGPDDADLSIYTNTGRGLVRRFYIDFITGNVGIGTTAPNNTIQVTGLINFPNTQYGTFLGYQAGNANTGAYNTFVGYQAGISNTTGAWNTANGYQALYGSNTTGNSNTANGGQALYSNTTGSQNTANGMRALYANTTGTWNTANGVNALFYNTTGYWNTANGVQALYSNTTGYWNTANSVDALANNTTGRGNTAEGVIALFSNTTGSFNTALGYNTGNGIVTGSNNTILGANVMGLAAGLSNNIIIADGSGNQRINVGSTGNVGIGTTAPDAKLKIINTAGNSDLAIGNIDFARSRLDFLTELTGQPEARIEVVGEGPDDADLSIYTNTGTGLVRRFYIDSNTGNIGIGTTIPNYQLQLSTDSAAKPSTNTWTIASDERIKTGIDDFTDGLSTVLKLRPRAYTYNGRGGPGYDDADTHIGFVAQEAEPVAPYLVQTGVGVIGGAEVSDFKYYQGHALPFIIVNAIKEQQKQIEGLKAENSALKNRIEILENK